MVCMGLCHGSCRMLGSGLDNLLRAESAFLTGHWQKDPSFELREAHQAIWIKQISGANKG
ncbi:L-arabinose isomerase [Frankliniella fusca]|uniref:L-arabinose isomerase n=1 Tax=Frankliniella fusca TaxID=407009 RepID=A0AAE1LC62_9NEOP|nr:L-arabinose isomerase [Frankliniella fusca]